MRPQFQTIKSKVKQILTDYKETRDDNVKLFYYYYKIHHRFNSNYGYLEFLLMMTRKEMPSTETLTRLSRQVQEQNPELRGEKWRLRKTVKTEIAKKDLGYK